MAGKFLLQWHTGRDLATSLPIYLIQIRLRRSRFFRRSLLGRKGRGTKVLSGSFFLNNQLKNNVPQGIFRVAKLWSPAHSSIPQTYMENDCG